MAECVKCRTFALCPWATPPEIICSQFKPVEQTNADGVRSMTDEELAHFMARVCPPGGKCNEDGNCFKCRLDWLKSPVEVDK